MACKYERGGRVNIVFLADLFVKDLPYGGGEKSNDELCKIARNNGHNVIELNCHLATLKKIYEYHEKNYVFIIANFICLESKIKNYITKNCKYIIIEHDHKYLLNRNPGLYPNFIAPSEQIINIDFYKNAKAVWCQSKIHKEVVEKNLHLNNIQSIGGNFWSDEELDYIANIRTDDKKGVATIVDYKGNNSKGTELSIKHCIDNNIRYSLVDLRETKEFLFELSQNKYLVFIPRTLETLSRIVIEAKMLDVKVKTIKKLIGAASEPWFELNSIFLVNYFRNNKIKFYNRIIESLK